MKLSEYISELEDLLQEHGDIEYKGPLPDLKEKDIRHRDNQKIETICWLE